MGSNVPLLPLVPAGGLSVNVRSAPQQKDLSATVEPAGNFLPAERHVLEIMGNLVVVKKTLHSAVDMLLLDNVKEHANAGHVVRFIRF